MRALWYPLLSVPLEDLLSLVDANETQIDAAGVNLLRYIAPGDEHDVLGDGLFDTEEVNGEMVVYWVTRLIESQPVDDVHCTEDTTGRAAQPVTSRERRSCCSFTAARRPKQHVVLAMLAKEPSHGDQLRTRVAGSAATSPPIARATDASGRSRPRLGRADQSPVWSGRATRPTTKRASDPPDDRGTRREPRPRAR
jgi:hypothetical protein